MWWFDMHYLWTPKSECWQGSSNWIQVEESSSGWGPWNVPAPPGLCCICFTRRIHSYWMGSQRVGHDWATSQHTHTHTHTHTHAHTQEPVLSRPISIPLMCRYVTAIFPDGLQESFCRWHALRLAVSSVILIYFPLMMDYRKLKST